MLVRSGDGVRLERTGWRCEAISARHRQWGYNCPAVDLDFVVAEYNYGKPVALVEYKERHAQKPVLDHPTYRALSSLADGYSGGPLPFFVAIYDSTDWWFRVVPVNDRSRKYYRNWIDRYMTERDFVRSLYMLRKRTLDSNDERAIARLNDALPRTDEATT